MTVQYSLSREWEVGGMSQKIKFIDAPKIIAFIAFLDRSQLVEYLGMFKYEKNHDTRVDIAYLRKFSGQPELELPFF